MMVFRTARLVTNARSSLSAFTRENGKSVVLGTSWAWRALENYSIPETHVDVLFDDGRVSCSPAHAIH